MNKIVAKVLNLLLIIYLGIILWIMVFGGFSLSVSGITVTAHKLNNPLIFVTAFGLMRFLIDPKIPQKLKEELIVLVLCTLSYMAYANWIDLNIWRPIFLNIFIALWMAKLVLNAIGFYWEIQGKLRDYRLIILAAILYFAYMYSIDGLRPGVLYEKGWYGWHDQGFYLRIAQDLSSFTLNPSNYVYGLGYPIAGALFYHLYPKDPFVIPNLIFWSLTIYFYFRVFKKYLPANWALMGILFLALGTPLLRFFIAPWNNSISTLGLACITFIATTRERINIIEAIMVGLMLGGVFSARYVDMFFILPLAIVIFYRERKIPQRFFKLMLFGGITFAIICSLVLYSHYASFGSIFKTPYHKHMTSQHTSDQDLGAYKISRIPDHLYSLFINPYIFHNIDYSPSFTPLLGWSFLFILSAAGFTVSIQERKGDIFSPLLKGFIMSLCLYGSFWSTSAHDMKYGSIRFFMMWYPILTLTAFLAFMKLLEFPKAERGIKLGLISSLILTALLIITPLLFNKYNLLIDDKTRLKNSSWKAYSNYNTHRVKAAIDNDVDTRWDTGKPQRPGMYYMVDLGRVYEISKIRFLQGSSVNDYPRGLALEVSIDGDNWQDIQLNNTLEELLEGIIEFSPVKVRYIKLVQKGSHKIYWWSIHELYCYSVYP